jgi:hypothetical protein
MFARNQKGDEQTMSEKMASMVISERRKFERNEQMKRIK